MARKIHLDQPTKSQRRRSGRKIESLRGKLAYEKQKHVHPSW